MQLFSKFAIALVFTVTCYSHASAQQTANQELNFQRTQNQRLLQQGPSLRKKSDTFRTQKNQAELALDTRAKEQLAHPTADEVASNRGKFGNRTATAVWWVFLPTILLALASWGCIYLISEDREKDAFDSEEESRQQRTRQRSRKPRFTKALADSQQTLSEEETLLNEINEMQEIASNATKPTDSPANANTKQTKQHT